MPSILKEIKLIKQTAVKLYKVPLLTGIYFKFGTKRYERKDKEVNLYVILDAQYAPVSRDIIKDIDKCADIKKFNICKASYNIFGIRSTIEAKQPPSKERLKGAVVVLDRRGILDSIDPKTKLDDIKTLIKTPLRAQILILNFKRALNSHCGKKEQRKL